jgi:hypothetical protein
MTGELGNSVKIINLFDHSRGLRDHFGDTLKTNMPFAHGDIVSTSPNRCGYGVDVTKCANNEFEIC